MSTEQRIRMSAAVEKPRVGGPAKGAGHQADCTCTRCAGFEPGNELAVTHGAYSSTLRLLERAQEITSQLVEFLGEDFEPKYGPVLEAASIAATRLEKAAAALDEATDLESVLKLSADARGWFRELVRVLESCGLTLEIGAGRTDVSVSVAAIKVEQDAATTARLFGKLQAIGLIQGADELPVLEAGESG